MESAFFPLFLKILNTKEARNQHQGGNKNKNARPFAQLLYYQHFCCTRCCSWTKAFVILQTWGSMDFRGQNGIHFNCSCFVWEAFSAAVGVRNHQFRLVLYLCLSRYLWLVVYILGASPDFWSINNLTSFNDSTTGQPPPLALGRCRTATNEFGIIQGKNDSTSKTGTWRPSTQKKQSEKEMNLWTKPGNKRI